MRELVRRKSDLELDGDAGKEVGLAGTEAEGADEAEAGDGAEAAGIVVVVAAGADNEGVVPASGGRRGFR